MRRLRIRAKGLNIATPRTFSEARLPPGAAAVALRKREWNEGEGMQRCL